MLFSMIKLQIKRNPGRSLLTAGVAACLLLLAGVYWENMMQTEKSLTALSESIPVEGTITDISGTRRTALEISTATVDRILESGYVKNAVYTGQAAGNLEGYNRVENPKVFDTTVVGSNSYAAFSALTEEKITFWEKGEEDFLSTDRPLCVVSEGYRKEHGIQKGDTLEFPLYSLEYVNGVTYHKVGMAKLQVIGSVEEHCFGDSSADVLVPIQWLRDSVTHADLPFSFTAMNFQVKNPMELNEFKKAMGAIGLQEKNQEAMEEVHGGTLLLDDTIFIENAEKLQSNLKTLKSFQLPFLLLVGVLIITLTFLIMRSRRLEIAIAASLGQKKSRVALQLFSEMGLLYFCGNTLGTLLLRLTTQIPLKALPGLFLLLFLEGILGSAVALYVLFRFDIMAMLTKAD